MQDQIPTPVPAYTATLTDTSNDTSCIIELASADRVDYVEDFIQGIREAIVGRKPKVEAVTPAPQYRLLNLHESLQEGDEYLVVNGKVNNWVRVLTASVFDKPSAIVRRLIQPSFTDELVAKVRQHEEENTNLLDLLEIERMRLTACSVVACADTPESAIEARKMLPEYLSASLSDVIRRVDECIRLREENKLLKANAVKTITQAQLDVVREKDATIKRLKEKLEAVEPFITRMSDPELPPMPVNRPQTLEEKIGDIMEQRVLFPLLDNLAHLMQKPQ